MLGITTKAQLTAAIKRAESAEAAALRYKQSNGRVLAECGKLIAEQKLSDGHLEITAWDLREAERKIAVLEARLAAFTGPRDRNERGHFLPTARRAS